MPLFRRRQRVADTFNRADNRHVSRWARPPERNTEEWIKTFGTNPRLAPVDRIASDLSFAPGKLYAIDRNGDEQEITSHSFLDFWDKMNPLHEFTSAALWQLFEIYLTLKGEGYFIMERDSLGRPCEMWPVPVHWVFTTPYFGFPFYRIRTSSGGIMEVSVDDMFIMKSLNPLDPMMRGLGVAESIADEIETDEYAAKFQKRFFYNDATPNIIVAMPKSTDEQRKRFRMEWLEKFKGIFKSHGVAVVNGEVGVQKISENMKDMDMVNGRIRLRDAMLEHLGIPREIMGITENSNRSTAEAAQFIYAQNVLMPRLRRREEAINRQLLPAFGDNLVWRFDNIVPRNQEFDKARAIEGWSAGLLLKDEARELLDLPPATTGGKVYKGTFSDIFIGEEEDPVEVTYQLAASQYEVLPSEEDAPLEEALDGDSSVTIEDEPEKSAAVEIVDDSIEIENDDEDMIDITDSFGRKAAGHRISLTASMRADDEAIRENSAAFEVAMMKYFREQIRKLGDALGDTQKAAGASWGDLQQYFNPDGTVKMEEWNLLDESVQVKIAEKFVTGLIDWPSEADQLKKIMEPLWRRAYDAGAKGLQIIYGVQSVKRPELVSTAKLRGGQRVVSVQDTTRTSISRIVSEGIAHGDSKNTISKAILKETEIDSAMRAKLIAQQETTTSLTTGQFDMMRSAGATVKVWHHRPQKNPRDGKGGTPNHIKMNGEVRGITEKFSNGLLYPRDPACADGSQTINCRCYITYGGF